MPEISVTNNYITRVEVSLDRTRTEIGEIRSVKFDVSNGSLEIKVDIPFHLKTYKKTFEAEDGMEILIKRQYPILKIILAFSLVTVMGFNLIYLLKYGIMLPYSYFFPCIAFIIIANVIMSFYELEIIKITEHRSNAPQNVNTSTH